MVSVKPRSADGYSKVRKKPIALHSVVQLDSQQQPYGYTSTLCLDDTAQATGSSHCNTQNNRFMNMPTRPKHVQLKSIEPANSIQAKVRQSLQRSREVFSELTKEPISALRTTSAGQIESMMGDRGRRTVMIKNQGDNVYSIQKCRQNTSTTSQFRSGSCDGEQGYKMKNLDIYMGSQAAYQQTQRVTNASASSSVFMETKASQDSRQKSMQTDQMTRITTQPLRRPVRVYRGSTANSYRRTHTAVKINKMFQGFPVSKAMITDGVMSMEEGVLSQHSNEPIDMDDDGTAELATPIDDSYLGLIYQKQSPRERIKEKKAELKYGSRSFSLRQQGTHELGSSERVTQQTSAQKQEDQYITSRISKQHSTPENQQPPVISSSSHKRYQQYQRNHQVLEQNQAKLRALLKRRNSGLSGNEGILTVNKGEWGISEQATERAIENKRAQFFRNSEYKKAQAPLVKKFIQRKLIKSQKGSVQMARYGSFDDPNAYNQPPKSRVKSSKYFGIVSKARKVTVNIAEAFGGRSATQDLLKTSVNDMRQQVEETNHTQQSESKTKNLAEKSATEGSTSDQATAVVSFQRFRNLQVVNTLLGASKNPMDENIACEKMDSIRSRLGYIPDLRLRIGRGSGQAQSINLNNFATAPSTSYGHNSIPTVNKKTVKTGARQNYTHATMLASSYNYANHESGSELDITKKREVHMFDHNQLECQKQKKLSRMSSLTSSVKKQTEVLPNRLKDSSQQQERRVTKEQVEQGYSQLNQIDFMPKQKEYTMQRLIPEARVPQTDGQWDFKVKRYDADTMAFNPSLTWTDNKPMIAARKAQKSFLTRREISKENVKQVQLDAKLKEFLANETYKVAQENMLQKFMDDQKQKMIAAENDGSDDELIQSVLQVSAKKANAVIKTKHNKKRDGMIYQFIRMQEAKKRKVQQEHEEDELRRMNGDEESFHSGYVQSDVEGEEHEQMENVPTNIDRESSIEKKLLRRMHESAKNNEEIYVDAKGKTRSRKRRMLLKDELSSPELRLKRFTSEFNNDDSLYENEDKKKERKQKKKQQRADDRDFFQCIDEERGDLSSTDSSVASFEDMSPKSLDGALKRLTRYLNANQLILFRQKAIVMTSNEQQNVRQEELMNRRLTKMNSPDHDVMENLNLADQQNSQSIVQGLKFKEASMETTGAIEEIISNDPTQIYQRRIMQIGDVMLPLINKIQNRRLILKDYTLNIGHCLALSEVWQKLGHPEVDVVHLDNCGVDDEQFSHLLKGFVAQKHLQLLYYKEHILGPLAMTAMEPLIMMRYPNHLRKLKLVKLNTASAFINELIDLLIDHSSNLNSLSLVQLQLSTQNISKINDFLDFSATLEELDLSWNNFRPADFTSLMENLQKNTTLRILNLSWNLMIASNAQKELSQFKYPSRMDKFFTRDIWDLNHAELMADRFSKFIRSNTQIQHLDLTNTGLNEVFLFDMLPALRRSKSLLAFHIGANPGITKRLTEYYHNKLRVAEKQCPFTIQVTKEKNNYKLALQDPQAQTIFSKQMQQQLERLSKEKYQRDVEETHALAKVNQDLMVNSLSEVTVKTTSADMSIYRILGHKNDVPGSGQWRMQTNSDEKDCWCCNGSIYSLVFWTSSIGHYHETQCVQIDDKEKVRVIRSFEMQNQDAEADNPPPTDVPLLYSNCTHWTAKPFMPLYEFLKMLKEEVLDFSSTAHNTMKQKHLYKYGYDEYKQQEMENWLEAETERLKVQHKDTTLKNHLATLKQKLNFKQPNFINYALIDKLEDTWVLPMFIKPGRTHFFVRNPQVKKASKQYFYSRHIVQARSEPLPRIAKQLRKEIASKEFSKEHSVFRNWREDTNQTIKGCLKHDFGWWKVPKFLKDETEVEACAEIIKRNFVKLKEVFLQIVGRSGDPPDIGQQAIHQFCTDAGIFDEAMTPRVLDIAFTASNYEEEEQDGNDDRALVRFEFFEILIRMVRTKYYDTKKTATIAEGLDRIIQEHVLPMHDVYCQWRTFRYEKLYDLEVNLLFERNMTTLETLYEVFQKTELSSSMYNLRQKQSTKFLGHQSLIELMQHPNLKLGISIRQIQQAFIMSKMTVENENETGPKEYSCIRFVEFLEFIGRIAFQKWIGTERDNVWPMHKKIFDILTCLFKLIEEEVIDPDSVVNQISDSDEDY